MYYGKPLFVSTKTDPDVFDKLILKKELQKKGVIERFYKENYVTCKNLFGLKTAFNLFVGMHVWFESNGEGLEKIQGVIEKPFGSFNKTGKFIVSVKDCDETFIKEKLGPGTNVVIDYKKVLFGRKRGDISQ